MTGYRLVHAALEDAATAVQLTERESGIGLIVRRSRRVVGFALHPRRAGSAIGADEMEAFISQAAAEGTMVEALRAELGARAQNESRSTLPFVSIVICTHDRTAGLRRALASLAQMRERSAHAAQLAEVIVVDNAPSTTATREEVARHPSVRYVLERKTGLDFARNSGWRAARGDIVAYLDDDVVVDAGWLDGLMRASLAHPDAAIVTGLVLPLTLEHEAQVMFEQRGGFRRGFAPRRWQGRDHLRDSLYPLGAGIFGAGANMAIRRDALEALGGFDEALDTGAPLPGGGDLDIFYRTLRSGRALVYEPGMSVLHEHRPTVEGLRRQYYTWGLGFFAFLGKVWGTDPTERTKARRLAKWFALDVARSLKARVGTEHPWQVEMILAEMTGGLDGAFGEYQRSQRRVAEIRRTTP